MGVDTQTLVMGSQVEGAPHRLVMEDVEVRIEDIVVNQLDLDLVLIVCKRAEVSVFALCNLLWILGTELPLVLVFSIELLDSVVGFETVISLSTVSLLDE